MMIPSELVKSEKELEQQLEDARFKANLCGIIMTVSSVCCIVFGIFPLFMPVIAAIFGLWLGNFLMCNTGTQHYYTVRRMVCCCCEQGGVLTGIKVFAILNIIIVGILLLISIFGLMRVIGDLDAFLIVWAILSIISMVMVIVTSIGAIPLGGDVEEALKALTEYQARNAIQVKTAVQQHAPVELHQIPVQALPPMLQQQQQQQQHSPREGEEQREPSQSRAENDTHPPSYIPSGSSTQHPEEKSVPPPGEDHSGTGREQQQQPQGKAKKEEEDEECLTQEEESELAKVLNEQDVQRRKDIWADLKTRLPTDKKDKDQRRKRFDLFKEFDRNNNKYLTPEDLSHGCQAVLGLGQLKKGLAYILPKAHANARAVHEVKGKEKKQSKESIERCEFRLVFVEIKKLFDLWFMFDTMDVASSGFISESEFESGVPQLKEWGKDVQDPKAEFATVDVAGNGKISFTEFCDFATANQLQGDEEDTDNDEDPETEDSDEAHRRNAADVERRKKIWEDLAHRLPTNRKSKEERARRFAYFREFDTNGNGFLTLADVEAGCETVLGLGQLGKGLHHILPLAHNSARGVTNVKGQDSDANQHVEKSEMRLLFVYIHQYFDLWFLFDHLDVANSGHISEDEFGKGMAEVEKWADVTIEDPKTEFAEADTGKTGHLIFLEFCEWAHHKNKKDE